MESTHIREPEAQSIPPVFSCTTTLLLLGEGGGIFCQLHNQAMWDCCCPSTGGLRYPLGSPAQVQILLAACLNNTPALSWLCHDGVAGQRCYGRVVKAVDLKDYHFLLHVSEFIYLFILEFIYLFIC
jgi:hypothetical protein